MKAMAMHNMTIRIDDKLKSAASEVAEYYGFDLSSVTRAFYKEMVDSQSIPLDLTRRKYVPIESEEEALDVADAYATELLDETR